MECLAFGILCHLKMILAALIEVIGLFKVRLAILITFLLEIFEVMSSIAVIMKIYILLGTKIDN